MGGRLRDSGLHAVLLAGGSGTRFWPWSRAARPKQFLALGDTEETLLGASWHRVRRVADRDRMWVAAPRRLQARVRDALPDLGDGRLVPEPSPRDTAPAIVLACAAIAREDADAVVGLFPSDHVVKDAAAFTRAVRAATRSARDGALVCLGVRPTRPATGFGYLACGPDDGGATRRVEKFVEKPDRARARRYVRSGRHLWNAGMFVWRAARFLEEARRWIPETVDAVGAHLDGDRTAWERTERISVDYAVMERAADVRVVPLDAGWDDVGSWDAAVRLREDAVGRGEPHEKRHVVVDSPGSAVFGDRRVVAVVDVPDVVVVETDDAVLVVSRSGSERVREAVDIVRRRFGERIL